ncbi:MAG TPA: GntR family transcriptional regulator [Geminicoccaceae bacterium]|nr:GntR family transcriptional regulator [Geminicoccaceae bacterium]
MAKVLALRTQATDPTEATSLVDEAYRALKTAIRDNVFPPGHQAAEPEIARQLGMSRTPVHEAIIRLQEEGLVQVLPRRGVLICPVSADDFREIYDLLIAIEGMAAALIAGLPASGAAAAAGELDDQTAAMSQALQSGNLLDWARADERFHELLTERCGNRRLARVAATVRDQAHRARLFTLHLRPLPTPSAGEHRRITDAIRAGDAPGAEAAARAHRVGARNSLLPLLIQYGMRNL